MDYVIDFTGYYVPNKRYMVKEFCLLPITSKQSLDPESACVKPPYAWNKLSASYQQEYTDRFYRKYGIDYSLGKCSVSDAFETIIDTLKEARIIYLKNESRKKFLTEFTGIPFNNVVCLDSRGYDDCPKVSPNLCSYHKSKKNCCVVKNALSMAEWLLELMFAPKEEEPLLKVDFILEPLDEATDVDFDERMKRYKELHQQLMEEIEKLKDDPDLNRPSDDESDSDGSSVSEDSNEVVRNVENDLEKIDDVIKGLGSKRKDSEDVRSGFDDQSLGFTESMKADDDYEPSNYLFPETEGLSQGFNGADDDDDDDDEVVDVGVVNEDEDEDDDDDDEVDDKDVIGSESRLSESSLETLDSFPEDESTIADSRYTDLQLSVISGPESFNTVNYYDLKSSGPGFEDSNSEISVDESELTEVRPLEYESMIEGSGGLPSEFDRESLDDSSVATFDTQPVQKRFKIY